MFLNLIRLSVNVWSLHDGMFFVGNHLTSHLLTNDPFQIPIRGDGDEELVFDHLVDLEIEGGTIGAVAAFFLQATQVFPDCGLGVVALAPRPVRKHVVGHVFKDGIEEDRKSTRLNSSH